MKATIARLEELRAARAALVDDMKAINAVAESQKRDLTAAEGKRYDELDSDFDALERQITRLEKLAGVESRMTREVAAPNGDPSRPGQASRTGADRDAGLGSWLAQEVRGLVEGTGSAGGFLVPEDFLSRVWDRLAASSVGLASGFTVMSTDRDKLHIPKVTADAASAWVSEGATISAADPTFDEIVATPRKLAVLTQLSNELIADSNPDVLDVLLANHLRSLALKLDLGFFEGSGSAPEIRGLKNVVGIQTVSAGTNGSTPANLDFWADAISLLEQANGKATAIVMHPRTWGTLIKIKEVSGSAKPVLQESAGSVSNGVVGALYGIPVFKSSQLSITETQGSSTDCSSSYVYQADQVVAVRREEARIELDRSRLFNSDQSEMRGILRFDVAVPNPTAVVRILGIRNV